MTAAAPLLARTRRILAATIIPAGAHTTPEELPTFEALIARVKALRAEAGRPLTFHPGRAAYPDFDPFRAITVRDGSLVIATLADRWPDDADMTFALGVLRRAGA